MMKVTIGLFSSSIILLIVFLFMLSPFNDFTAILNEEGSDIIDDVGINTQMSTFLNNIPMLFGILSVLMFLGGVISFTVNALKREHEEFEYNGPF